jgi:hypothetical protein
MCGISALTATALLPSGKHILEVFLAEINARLLVNYLKAVPRASSRRILHISAAAADFQFREIDIALGVPTNFVCILPSQR